MSPASFDPWTLLFFCGAAVLIAIQALRGWRMGIVRQVVDLIGIASAYAVAYLAGPHLVPVLRPLGLPDQVLRGLAGSGLGFLTYLAITVTGVILFKRTAQQSIGLVRFGFGVGGALVGAFFGLVIVWVLALGIRVCGTLAESKVRMSEMAQAAGHAVHRASVVADPGWMRGLVHMKDALEQGLTGTMVKEVDPLPKVLYSTIGRIGAMLSSEQSVDRFLSYPGIRPLAEHPKVVGLMSDPEIVREMQSGNYLGLLHNARLVQAVNDEEIQKLMQSLDVEKALDYALGNAEKPRLASPPR